MQEQQALLTKYLELQGNDTTRINLLQLVAFVLQFPIPESLKTYGTTEGDLFYQSSLHGLANTLLSEILYAEKKLDESDLVGYHYWLRCTINTIQIYSKHPENIIKAADLAQTALDENKPFVAITIYPTPLVVFDTDFPELDLTEKKPIDLPSPVDFISITNYRKGSNNIIESAGEWHYQIEYEKMVDVMLARIQSFIIKDLDKLSAEEKQRRLQTIAAWLVEVTFELGNPNQDPEVKYSFVRETQMVNLLRSILPFVEFPEFIDQSIEQVKFLPDTRQVTDALNLPPQNAQDLAVEELELTLQHALEYLEPIDPASLNDEEKKEVINQIQSLLVFNAHRTARVMTDPHHIEWIESDIIPILARYRNSPEFLKEVVRAIPLDRQ